METQSSPVVKWKWIGMLLALELAFALLVVLMEQVLHWRLGGAGGSISVLASSIGIGTYLEQREPGALSPEVIRAISWRMSFITILLSLPVIAYIFRSVASQNPGVRWAVLIAIPIGFGLTWLLHRWGLALGVRNGNKAAPSA